MTPQERILCIYYRLGWITNYQQQPCPNCHQTTRISNQHLISCHHVRTFLSISTDITDPIYIVLNRIPKSPPASFNKRLYLKIIWSKLCFILHQLHRTCRPEQYTTPSPPINKFSQSLLQWKHHQPHHLHHLSIYKKKRLSFSLSFTMFPLPVV